MASSTEERTGAPPPAGRGTAIVVCIVLALLVAAVYGQTVRHPFITLDDEEYVARNAPVLGGLSPEGVRWAFTTFRMANWHPLAWLSHMADVSLLGPDPGISHLVNGLLHLSNAILLFLLLRGMTGALWRSAVAAALFAVHPLNVEAVAWVAERKELLSTLFLFLALGAYLRYVRRPAVPPYLASAVLYACALMSKPTGVTFPFLLLILDWWPLGRTLLFPPADGSFREPHPPRRLLVEKIPFFALSAASCVVTLIAQGAGGAVQSLERFPLPMRLANALAACGAYLWKAACPVSLAVFYPYPLPTSRFYGEVLLSAVALCALTLLVLREARRRPYLAAGWFWFLGTMVPMIGLVQVGGAAMADRYAYLPLAGIFVAVVWGGAGLAEGIVPRRTAPAVAAAAILVLAFLAWRQAGYWKDSVTLFTRTLAVTERNGVAWGALGKAWNDRGEPLRAIESSREALRILPAYDLPYRNMGEAYDRLGRPEGALGAFREAVRLKPDSAAARYNLGLILVRLGRSGEAIDEYRAALRIDPNHAEAWNNLGTALHGGGSVEEAIRCYREALSVNPRHAESRFNLGVAYGEKGRSDLAAENFREVLRLLPGNREALRRLREAEADVLRKRSGAP